MLLVRHALGWFGDAGYEHVEELMAQLEHLSGGTWTLSEDRGGSLTGGGHGYFLIWGAARGLGLPFAAGQALQLVLEAGMLVAFARLGRGVIDSDRLSAALLVLAWIPYPKLHLAENSVLVGLVMPLVFVAWLGARDGSPRAHRLPAALFGGAVHLGLIALPVLPLLVGLPRRGGGFDRAWVGRGLLYGGAAGLALLPLWLSPWSGPDFLETSIDAASREGLGASLRSIAGQLAGLLKDPLLALGLVWAWTKPGPGRGPLLLWLALTTLPIVLLDRGDGGSPFHFAAAAPAWAMLGAEALIDVRRRWGEGGVVGVLAVATLVAAVPRGSFEDPPTWRAEPIGDRCAAVDSGTCRPRLAASILDRLDDQGLGEARAHGAYAGCLDAAQRWRGQPPGTDREALLLDSATAERMGAPADGTRPAIVAPVRTHRPTARGAEVPIPAGWNLLLVEGDKLDVPVGDAVYAAAGCASTTSPRAPRTLRTGAWAAIRSRDPATVQVGPPGAWDPEAVLVVTIGEPIP
ncbi:MAG: hypothetical protein GY898_25660 [Proteobacteria bacterium]|nr:hypothetical protein [Pseudomonadota bacterium]